MLGLFGRAQRPAQSESLENAIGPTSSLKGRLRSDGGVRIDGAFDGTIEVAGNVVVGPEGRVTGNITARNVIVGGVVNGDIDGTGQLQILSSGKVFGDISMASFTIDDGGMFQGASRMRGLDQPALAPPRDVPSDDEPDGGDNAQHDGRTVEATARLAVDQPAARAAAARGEAGETGETGETGSTSPTDDPAPPVAPDEDAGRVSKPTQDAPGAVEPARKGPVRPTAPQDDDFDLDLDAMGIEPVIPEIVIEDVEDEGRPPAPEQETTTTSRRGRTSRRSNKRAG